MLQPPQSRRLLLPALLLLVSALTGRAQAQAGARGYSPQMLVELFKNGVSEDRILGIVNSGCLRHTIKASDGVDIKTAGASAEFMAKLGRACIAPEVVNSGGSNASAVSAPATPAPVPTPAASVPSPVAPTPAAAAPASAPTSTALPSIVSGAANTVSGATTTGGASTPPAPVQQFNSPVRVANEQARSAAPAPDKPAPTNVPSAATMDVPGLGAVKASIDAFECPALSGQPDRFLGSPMNRFDSRLTRFVCARVRFVSAQPVSGTPAMKLACVFEKEGLVVATGALDGSPTSPGVSDWEAYIQHGKEEYDSWGNGAYSITCNQGDAPLVRVPFSVYTSAAVGDAIPSLNARVLALRVFQTPGEIVKLEQRQYSDVFMASKVRRIGMELQVMYPPPSGTVSETVVCRWKALDENRELSADTITVAPKADAGGTVSSRAHGLDVPGSWSTGNYEISCALGDKMIASTKFTLR